MISIGSPSMFDIELDSSSSEENSVDFWENIVKIFCVIVGKDRNDLSAWHLNELHVWGGNISSVVGGFGRVLNSFFWFISFIRKGEDSNDGSLRRHGRIDGQN